MNYDVDWAKEHLNEHSIKPSTIRIKILQYLMDNRIHPTVEEIYKKLIDKIPTLSKTSVYNTLELFLENGIVQLVNIDEKESRYDIDTSFHGHFKCEKCGKVYDFNITAKELGEDNLKDFCIKDRKIYYEGICKDCLEKD